LEETAGHTEERPINIQLDPICPRRSYGISRVLPSDDLNRQFDDISEGPLAGRPNHLLPTPRTKARGVAPASSLRQWRLRRNLVIAGRSGEGLLTIYFTDVHYRALLSAINPTVLLRPHRRAPSP